MNLMLPTVMLAVQLVVAMLAGASWNWTPVILALSTAATGWPAPVGVALNNTDVDEVVIAN